MRIHDAAEVAACGTRENESRAACARAIVNRRKEHSRTPPPLAGPSWPLVSATDRFLFFFLFHPIPLSIPFSVSPSHSSQSFYPPRFQSTPPCTFVQLPSSSSFRLSAPPPKVVMSLITGEQAGLGRAYKHMTFTPEELEAHLKMRQAGRKAAEALQRQKQHEKYHDDHEYRAKILENQERANAAKKANMR